MRRLGVAILMLSVAVTGCRLQQTSAPTPTPAPTVSPVADPSPAEYRVAVVDLPALLKAHRRWPQLDALNKRTEALYVRLSNPPPPPEPPQAAVAPDLQAEADRLRAEMQAEIAELEAQLHRRLEAYVNDLKAEQEAKLADRQREINAELSKVVEAKRDELQRELDRFELATMAEYRVPLFSLRVKADVVGISNEEEAKRLNAEGERLQKEIGEKIRTKAQALEKDGQDFARAKTAEAEAGFKVYLKQLEDDANEKIEAKQAEARAEIQAAARQREETFKAAMTARQKTVVGSVEAQMLAARERYIRQVEAEAARLRKEIQELQMQRVRLEDSMLAEIRIEVATLAQIRKIDAVISQTIAHRGVIDLTSDVASRLK